MLRPIQLQGYKLINIKNMFESPSVCSCVRYKHKYVSVKSSGLANSEFKLNHCNRIKWRHTVKVWFSNVLLISVLSPTSTPVRLCPIKGKLLSTLYSSKWLAHWTSDLKVGGSPPSPCHRVVSLDKKLYPTLSLSTRVGKWVLATYCLG